jgi:hypothetical protein
MINCMNNNAYIAVAWGSPGGATAEISIAIEEIVGKRPKPVRLGDLAGPNETIQVLLSTEDWILIAKAIAAIYGAELVKEAAKATWKAAAPKISQVKTTMTSLFERLVSGISNALHAKAPVVLGLYWNPKGGKRRHIGIEVTDKNPEEIARLISILATNGHEIEQKLEEWDKMIANRKSIVYEENSDCSVKLIVSDDGNIQLRATVWDDDISSKETFIYEIIKKK